MHSFIYFLNHAKNNTELIIEFIVISYRFLLLIIQLPRYNKFFVADV